MVNLRQAFRQVSPEKAGRPYRLVVYVTGGPEDQRLLEIVEKIGQHQNTFITIAYVVEVQQSMPLDAELPYEIERGEHALRSAETLAEQLLGDNRQSPVRTELLQARSAGAAIVDEAIDRNADMILLASTLRRKYGRVTTGETIAYVLKNAPCEVILVRLALPDWQSDDVEQP